MVEDVESIIEAVPKHKKSNDLLKSKANKIPFGKYTSVNFNGRSSFSQVPVKVFEKKKFIGQAPYMTYEKGASGKTEKCWEA